MIALRIFALVLVLVVQVFFIANLYNQQKLDAEIAVLQAQSIGYCENGSTSTFFSGSGGAANSGKEPIP